MTWENLAETVQKRIPEDTLVLFLGIALFGVLSLGFLYVERFNTPPEQEVNSMMLNTVKELRDQLVTFKAENAGLKAELDRLKTEIQSMRAILMALESGNNPVPFAYWLKDRSGAVLYANSLYEATFLSCRGYVLEDYLNKSDYEVWPKEVADEFRKNDLAVIQAKKALLFSEPVETCKKTIQKMTFVKWPRTIGSYIVGVAGMYIPSPENIHNMGVEIESE